ncbi:MAG: superoxide dismutase family protein [Parvibaculaceae bacterium]|nr:superoxide dismutase family protein [Parvibaculaceae bacterium]
MKFMQIAPLAGLFALASLPAMAEAQAMAAGTFRTADRDEAGTADLTEGPGGVLLRIEVEGLEPGWHGIHFHAVGDCSDEGFKKSGAHTHHEAEKPPHGLLNPEGPDDGDLPNIYADENGVAKAELYSPFVTLTGAEGRANLLDEDGAAIVIHEGQDDHMSQPIGGAGDRVACAVIEKAE